MYAVTADYVTAIKKPAIRSRVAGTIAGISFGDENILGGSLSITGQNSSDNNVEIGTVYISELSVTLRGLELERYNMGGMEIRLFFELLLGDGATWESVPVGRYYVGEANHTAAGVVIKAYDVLSKLDKACPLNATTGTPYQLAKYACESCSVTLATGQETFTAFANGSRTMGLWTDGADIETWRDFISWVAQSCACYVTANRLGQVEFRPYTQDVIDTVDPTGRFKGASYSDYETRYTGLYCMNIEDSTLDYYGLSVDDGLTYSLGANPFFQYGLNETRDALRTAVLEKIALIRYVPFSVTLPENPAYDLGDVLSFPGGLGDAGKLFCINKLTWTYHKGIRLEGVGENPALATAQSKTDKSLAGLISRMNGDAMHYYDFINVEDIVVRDGETQRLMEIRYVTTKDTHVDFHAELRMQVDTLEEVDDDEYTEHDVQGAVTYYLNDELVAYSPVFTETDGPQLKHLVYFWQSSANIICYWRVELTVNGGDIAIPAGQLHAYMAGEGLVGERTDTNPSFYDDVGPLEIDVFGPFTDMAEASTETPASSSISDSVAALNFSTVLAAFTDSMEACPGVSVTPYLSTGYLGAVTVPSSGVFWTATEDGQYIETSDFSGVAGFVSPDGGALSYMCSFDSGEAWKGWNGSEWEAGLEMTYATISSLTGAQFGSGPVRFMIIFDNGESLSGFTAIGGSI